VTAAAPSARSGALGQAALETPPHRIGRLPDQDLRMALLGDPEGNPLAPTSEARPPALGE
jgi:hypothetical protein